MKLKFSLLSTLFCLLALTLTSFAADPTANPPQDLAAITRSQVRMQVKMAADGPARIAQQQAMIEQMKASALARLNDAAVAAVFTADELASLKALLK